MPKITIPVSYTDATVTRPVVDSIVKQFMYYTQMRDIKDIIFTPKPGAQQAMQQVVSLQEPLRLEVNNLLKVDYSEDYDRELWDVTKDQANFPPIFADPKLGVSVTPLYSKVVLTLNITYQAKSSNDITQWLNGCRRRNQFSNPGFNHDISYYYDLPTEVLAYIAQIHGLRENISGYGDTMKNYFLSHLVDGLNLQSNQAGSGELIIAVRNNNISGNFDQYEPPVPDTQKEPPLTTVNFTYVVRYDRVTDLVLEYQHYIHNQVVNLSFLQQFGDRNSHYDMLVGKQPASNYIGLSQKNAAYEEAYKDHGTYYGDGWRPVMTPPNMKTNFITPIQIDLDNLRVVLNLDDLVNFGFSQSLINVLKRHYIHLKKIYKWFAYIEMYEVNEEENFLPFIIQPNGNALLMVDPILRNRHYFRILSNYDLLNASFDDIDIEDLIEILHWLDPNFPDEIIDIDAWSNEADKNKIKNYFGKLNLQHGGMKTVQIATVISKKVNL
jgi:hypothetical protein